VLPVGTDSGNLDHPGTSLVVAKVRLCSHDSVFALQIYRLWVNREPGC